MYFFISTTILISTLTSISLLLISIISLIATIVELFSTRIFNDNLLIPVSIGLLLTIAGVS